MHIERSLQEQICPRMCNLAVTLVDIIYGRFPVRPQIYDSRSVEVEITHIRI